MLPEDQQIKYKYNFVRQNGGDKQIIRAMFENNLRVPVEIWERPIPEPSGASGGIPHRDFESEAQLLTIVRHDSFLRVFDYHSKNGYHYLATETTGGNNLQELLREKPEIFTLANVLKWSEQLIAALDYLHKQSPVLIHGAIKPENIVLTPNGRIKLLPFGVAARATETSQIRGQQFDPIGLHFSPLEQIWSSLDSASQKTLLRNYDETSEQILRQPADERSDIYALGATLYHLLTHRTPIDALERSIDLLDGKKDPLPAPSAINPAVSPEVSDLLVKALAIKRENRLASAAAMMKIIGEPSAETPVVSTAAKTFSAAVSNKPAAPKPILQNDVFVKQAENQISETVQEAPVTEIKKSPKEVQLQKADTENLVTKQVELPAPPILIKELLPEKAIEDQSDIQIVDSQYHSAEAEIADEFVDIEEKAAPPKVEPPSSAPSLTPEVFENIFVAQPKSGGRRAAFIAFALMLVFGGSALAIWKAGILKPAVMQQTVSAAEEKPISVSKQNNSVPEKSETSENTQADSPAAEKSEPVAEAIEPAETKPEAMRESGGGAQIYKNKPVSVPRIAKADSPAKPAPEKKKPVTIDDLISDN